jgi:sugar lactone lactonase YvrE
MVSRSYINFDLSIERYADNYLAHVLQSCAGEGSVEFELPFSALELENFILKMGQARRASGRGADSPEWVAAREFGTKLFGAVFQGDVYTCLGASLAEAQTRQQGLRLLLRLPPELTHLPWEYLYNPVWNQFFSLSSDTSLVRYLELSPPLLPLVVKPPLRLLVVISSPGDYDPLNVEREWDDLWMTLQPLVARGSVVVERLENASLPALQRQLRGGAYHILHFIGYSIFDRQKQNGLLLFSDEHGRGQPLSGQDLGTVLRDHNSLRLIVLNACKGAHAGHNNPFAGVANSLMQMGLPAVIAMQFGISDSSAILFNQEFYTTLADGHGVDAALGSARKSIFASRGGVEWGAPVLFNRIPDGQIFVPPGSATGAQLRSSRSNLVYRNLLILAALLGLVGVITLIAFLGSGKSSPATLTPTSIAQNNPSTVVPPTLTRTGTATPTPTLTPTLLLTLSGPLSSTPIAAASSTPHAPNPPTLTGSPVFAPSATANPAVSPTQAPTVQVIPLSPAPLPSVFNIPGMVYTLGVSTNPTHLNNPVDMAVDSLGNLWVIEHGTRSLVSLDARGNFRFKVDVQYPMSVVIDAADHIYVLDWFDLSNPRRGGQVIQLNTVGAKISQWPVTDSSSSMFPITLMAGKGRIAVNLVNYLTLERKLVWYSLAGQKIGEAILCSSGSAEEDCQNIAISPLDNHIFRIHQFIESDSPAYEVIEQDENGVQLRVLVDSARTKGKFNYPNAIRVGLNGWIYVSNASGGLFFIDPAGQVDKKLDSGAYTLASDPQGYLYIIDFSYTIRKVDRNGNKIIDLSAARNQPGEFFTPKGIDVQGGRLYVCDADNQRIQIFSSTGEYLNSWSLKNLAISGAPQDIEVTQEGQVYLLTDTHLYYLDQDGKKLQEWQPDFPSGARALSVDPAGNVYLVQGGSSTKTDKEVIQYTPQGVVSARWKVKNTNDIAIAPDGTFWVAGMSNLIHLDAQGRPIGEINVSAESIWVDGRGNVYSYNKDGSLTQYDPQGRLKANQTVGSYSLGVMLSGDSAYLSGDENGNVYLSLRGLNYVVKIKFPV